MRATPLPHTASNHEDDASLVIEHRDVDEADTMNVLHFAVNADPKTAVPRPPQHSSIPSLLTSLQNEYDAIILETFTLKKHYDNLRQELAHALYANDASARVIARLLNERDQAREALASIQGTIGAGPSSSKAAHDVEMTDSAPAGNGASNAAAGNGLSRGGRDHRRDCAAIVVAAQSQVEAQGSRGLCHAVFGRQLC